MVKSYMNEVPEHGGSPFLCQTLRMGLSVFSVENKTDIALDMVLTEVRGWLMSVW